MFALLCLVSFLAVGGISGAASLKHNHVLGENEHGKPYSVFNSTNMALSIIARQQGIMINNTTPSSALQAGIVQKAFAAYNQYYGAHPQIQEYIDHSSAASARYMASTIDDVKNWPLDRLSNGNAMLRGTDPAYGIALAALRDSIHLNQRNKEEGLWYWESYPDWSYLDGMYSLGPFLALDSGLPPAAHARSNADSNITTAEIGPSPDPDATTPALNDMGLQFRLLWDHCYNATTGLLVHGYDASRRASWASRTSGASAVVWGRSLGWFMMALVDTLELLRGQGGGHEHQPPSLTGMYQSLAQGVMRHADTPGSGGWFQVVDMPRRQGNYVESSATAMFAYALLKGARLGYLGPAETTAAREAGRAAYYLLLREFVTVEDDGTLGWNGTVAVCSLNSTATYDVSSNLLSFCLNSSHPHGDPLYERDRDRAKLWLAVLHKAAHRAQQRPRRRRFRPGFARGRAPQRQTPQPTPRADRTPVPERDVINGVDERRPVRDG